MLYAIIFIIGLITILLFLLWWFLLRKTPPTTTTPTTTPTRSLFRGNLSLPQNFKSSYDTLRQNGYSIPTQNTNIDYYSAPQTVDQEILLEMNKKKPPHPVAEFTSNLSKLGDPFRGDLIIPPRRSDVSVPYNASIDDIRTGYFS